MTLTDLVDTDPHKMNQKCLSDQVICIQNNVEHAMENYITTVEELDTEKDKFDTELKFSLHDLLLYGKKCEYLLQIAEHLLKEYKNNQGWITSGSADQELFTVFEELLDENDQVDLEYTVEKIHLGITGEEVLTHINGDLLVEDEVSEAAIDVSLSDVINGELDITNIENTEDPVKKKIIWQANVLEVIRSGLKITEIIDEVKEFKNNEFRYVTFEYYSNKDLMSEMAIKMRDMKFDIPEDDIDLDDI